MEQNYDVVIVGGGAAGLSGALALSRARRSVLVVDSGEPRNAPTGHVHNFLTRDGTPPGELLATGRAEVAGYGGQFTSGEAVSARAEDAGFEVKLADGRSVRARRLLVATGLADELPDLPGVRELWGRDVLHCPYCHGWEVRDEAVGILATSAFAIHAALLWRQWSADITLFRHTAPDLTTDQVEELVARGIRVVDHAVAELEVTDGRLSGVRLTSGELVRRNAVVVTPTFIARSALLESLGLQSMDVELNGRVYGRAFPADPNGATTVPGVWVAGNVTDLRAQLINAAAAGLSTGAMINADLVAKDTRRAVAAARAASRHGEGHDVEHQTPGHDLGSWEERYRAAPGLWSGRPNAQLVTEVSGLTPGRALDLGCGEGADAVWLASQGWQTVGADWSSVALERAAEHARQAGVDDLVEWAAVDVRDWTPPQAAFDLVSAQFLHPTAAERPGLLARAAAAVAPGGTLLWVGHDIDERHLHWGADRFASVEALLADLPDDGWDVEVAEVRARPALAHQEAEAGHHVSDVVIKLRRR